MHPVFGKAVRGMDVADKISRVKGGKDNKPDEKVLTKKRLV